MPTEDEGGNVTFWHEIPPDGTCSACHAMVPVYFFRHFFSHGNFLGNYCARISKSAHMSSGGISCQKVTLPPSSPIGIQGYPPVDFLQGKTPDKL